MVRIVRSGGRWRLMPNRTFVRVPVIVRLVILAILVIIIALILTA